MAEKKLYQFKVKDFAQNDFPLYVFLSKDSKDFDFQEHTHDCIEVVFVVKGSGVNFVDKVAYPIIAGDVFFSNMSSIHSFYTHTEMVYYNLMFKPELFSAAELQQLQELPFFNTLIDFSMKKTQPDRKANILLSPPYTEIIRQRFSNLEHEVKGRKVGYRLAAKAQLIMLITELCRIRESQKNLIEGKVPDNNFDSFSKAVEFINKNYCRQISIKDVAKAGNLSRSYICEFFKKESGTTIVKYINSLRIEKARKMLLETDLNISEICFKCGFTDSTYFSKIFRQSMGQSPSSYREGTK